MEPVFALTPLEQQELLDKSRREAAERERILNEKDVFLQPDIKFEKPELFPQEAFTFKINTILLEGPMVERFGWTRAVLATYEGQEMGTQGLNQILKELTNGFIARGYVTTRVQIAEQDLSQGVLRIQLVPGIIRDIRFAEGSQTGSWWTAFPTRPGRILNLRDLEQGLEQMKRVPSQDVEMDIAPGEKPGESDVVITLKKKRAWRILASADDSGSESTGKYQGSVSLSLDNPLQHNDLFSYTYSHDLDKGDRERGTSNNNFYYSMPYGFWTFSFTTTTSEYHQTAQGLFSEFQMSGESDNHYLKAQRVVHRDADSKVTVDFQLIRKFSKSFMEDIELEVQRKDTTAVEVGISRRKNFSTGLVDIRLAGRRGVPWFGAMEDAHHPNSPTSEYFLGTLDLNLVQQVKLGKLTGRYSFDFKGQATSDKVYGTEFLSIGNRYTVRGFDGEYTLSAENGFYIRNELSIPLDKFGTEVYLGIDYGQVSGPSAKYLLGSRIAGSALGIRGGYKGFFYDVFAGVPIYKPQGYPTADVAYGFSLGYQY